MKIVNSKKFYELPSGTLFCDYEPCIISDLKIKHDTVYRLVDDVTNERIGFDYYYQGLIGDVDCDDGNEMFDILTASQKNSELSFSLDDSMMRDGLFDDTRFYVVYEDVDIKRLISQLSKLI